MKLNANKKWLKYVHIKKNVIIRWERKVPSPNAITNTLCDIDNVAL